MLQWSNLELLSAYKKAEKKPGIYIIGDANRSQPVNDPGNADGFFGGNWPLNFAPYYVGISESKNKGIYDRLKKHSKGKGSKRIADRLKNGEVLYFISAVGEGLESFESVFLCLKTNKQFSDNIRSELERNARRQNQKIRDAMPQHDKDFFDNLDFDGRGV